MDQDVLQKLSELEDKIEETRQSVEKIRRMFVITFWVTVAVIVLPLVAAAFIIPAFINSYTSTFEGLL